MEFWEFFKKLLDPESIIEFGGLALLLIVMFAETGLLVGFFLPGDSLVFIAGMICVSKPHVLDVTIYTLLLLMSIAAILGNIAGYWFGYKVGPPLFARKDSLLFKKQYLIVTQKFYDKNGGRTLIIGRFLPIIRTFAPILAGVFKMDFKKFLLYNVIGAVAWIGLLGGAGYYLGSNKWIQKNIGIIVIFLIIITLVPVFNSFRKKKHS